MNNAELAAKLEKWWDCGAFATAEARALASVLRGEAAGGAEPLEQFPQDVLEAVYSRAGSTDLRVSQPAAALLAALERERPLPRGGGSTG